jgi:hypothetical protein
MASSPHGVAPKTPGHLGEPILRVSSIEFRFIIEIKGYLERLSQGFTPLQNLLPQYILMYPCIFPNDYLF